MPGAFGTADEATLKQAAADEPGTDGVDLVATVTTADVRRVYGGEITDSAQLGGAPGALVVLRRRRVGRQRHALQRRPERQRR